MTEPIPLQYGQARSTLTQRSLRHAASAFAVVIGVVTGYVLAFRSMPVRYVGTCLYNVSPAPTATDETLADIEAAMSTELLDIQTQAAFDAALVNFGNVGFSVPSGDDRARLRRAVRFRRIPRSRLLRVDVEWPDETSAVNLAASFARPPAPGVSGRQVFSAALVAPRWSIAWCLSGALAGGVAAGFGVWGLRRRLATR